MIKELYAEDFIEPMGEGQSVPYRIIADDGEQYILKNQRRYDTVHHNYVHDDMMFLNELLCYQIALYLDIPIPEAAIIYVEQESITDNPRIYFAHKFNEGFHYASTYIPDFETNYLSNQDKLRAMKKPLLIKSWNAFFDKIENPETFASIVALDILVANFDRYNNFGNVQISHNQGNRKLYALDYGHAFTGPEWDILKKQRLLTEILTPTKYHQYILGLGSRGAYGNAGTVFKALEKFIDLNDIENHSFKDVVYKIECINDVMIDTWLSNIPESWYVDESAQKELLKEYLLAQKSNLREMIGIFADNNAFSNYRGGGLAWKNVSQASSDTV